MAIEHDFGSPPEITHLNDVALRGRLAAAAERRELPSGDLLLTFRLIVDRPSAPGETRRRVDTIDCAAWSGRVQRTVRGWTAGELVCVEGQLRRRFLRSERGTSSRVEVEVLGARRARPPASQASRAEGQGVRG